MRKLIVSEFVSLDGVIQAPGGKDEDTDGGPPIAGSATTYTMCSGIAVLLLFVAVGLFANDDGTPLHPWAGLLQRVLCAAWFTWMIVLAVRLRAVSSGE